MTVRTREIYRSEPNGDRWLLVVDGDNDRLSVRHEPNRSSGGRDDDVELGDFLIAPGEGPEKHKLLQLIGTLVTD